MSPLILILCLIITWCAQYFFASLTVSSNPETNKTVKLILVAIAFAVSVYLVFFKHMG